MVEVISRALAVYEVLVNEKNHEESEILVRKKDGREVELLLVPT